MKKKRVLSLFTAFAMFLTLLSAMPAISGVNVEIAAAESDYGFAAGEQVNEGTYNGLKYLYNSQKAVIKSYEGTATSITIPKTINGLPVTNIAEKAFYKNTTIKNVKIEAEIPEIPINCFSICSNLESVTIPSSVEIINDYAFYQCKKLDAVVLPANLETIGVYAFDECYALSSIIIPEKVTTIGESAFGFCKALSGVIIPEKVTTIGARAFWCCSSLSSITILGNITLIGDRVFESCTVLHDVTISGNVSKLGSSMFASCENLEEIMISGNTVSIDSRAFSGCRELKKITIPASVNSISDTAFSYCIKATIHGTSGSYAESYANTNNIPFNVDLIYGTTTDGIDYLINGSEAVVTGYLGTSPDVTIPKKINNVPVSRIAPKAFSGNSTIVNITINAEITEIPEGCFDSMNLQTNLKSVKMPSTVTSIDEDAFRYCEYLVNIELSSGLLSIADSAFNGCTSLSSIDLPSGLETIGNCAFRGCSKLSNIELPSSLTSIGSQSFQACSSLLELTLPLGLKTIPHTAFCGCVKLETVTISDTITQIDSDAFKSCKNLKKVNIPANVKWIDNSAFLNCDKLVIYGDTGSYAEQYANKNNIPFNLEMIYGTTDEGIEYIIKNGEEVTVTGYVGTAADVTIPKKIEGVPVLKMSNGVFSGNTKIKSVVIEAEITDLPDYTFSGGTRSDYNLKSVTLPSSIKTIGYGAFNDRRGITSITLPEGLNYIGEHCFGDCYGLSSITIPEGVTTIGSATFQCCTNLKSVSLPSSLITIESYAFNQCSNLSNINIPKNVKTIGENAFCFCSFEKIELPESFTSLGESAFRYCTSLVSITIPSSVKTVPSNSFEGCSKLKNVDIKRGVTTIGNQAFKDCTSLDFEFINFPDTVTSIGTEAFSGCTSFEKVTIPKNVKTIGSKAFGYCNKIYGMGIPAAVNSIADDTFINCHFIRMTIDNNNSYAINYAKNHNIPYNSLKEYANGGGEAEINDIKQDDENIAVVAPKFSAVFNRGSVLKIVNNSSSQPVKFECNVVNVNDLDDFEKEILGDYATVMDFTLRNWADEKIEFGSESDNSYVTITIKCDSKIAIGGNSVEVYYVDPVTKTEQKIENAVYNSTNNTVTFKTTHFSYYALKTVEGSGNSGGNTDNDDEEDEEDDIIDGENSGHAIGKIKIEDIISKDVFDVILPTVPEGTLNFILDPQHLITATNADAYSNLGFEANQSLYFANAPAVIGDSITYSHISDGFTAINLSNKEVTLKVTGTLKNTDGIEITEDAPENDKAQIQMKITGGTSDSVIFKTENGITSAALTATIDKVPDDKFEVKYNSQKGYSFGRIDDFDDSTAPSYTFKIEGAASYDKSGKAWKDMKDIHPEIEIVWSIENPFK